jgi:luciferase family oxidoreductase group 1
VAVPLSVLDLATVWSGRSHTDAVRASIELAREVEQLGFERFWLAEHHNMSSVASSAPAVLIAAVAAATTHIRVGSGGVMLPNHPPLVIAEQFGTLEALYPGRIDLGIGRAPGTDPRTAAALRRGPDALGAEDFPRELGELLAFFRGTFPEGHRYRSITAVPGAGDGPPIWLLGSSDFSAQLAGLLGLPFAFAHHFSPDNTQTAMQRYRQRFTPSDALTEPHSMITVQVVCADTDDEAITLAEPSALGFARVRLGGLREPLPSPEEVATHEWSEPELAVRRQRLAGQAIGSPATVHRVLTELLELSAADELMITTPVYDAAVRLRSMELVKALFDSTAAAAMPSGAAPRSPGQATSSDAP